jgi:hypothetical protein
MSELGAVSDDGLKGAMMVVSTNEESFTKRA